MKLSDITNWWHAVKDKGLQQGRIAQQGDEEVDLERETRIYQQEYHKIKHLYQRVDRKVRMERLYLQTDLSLTRLARLVGTNRTYLSRAFSLSGENFRDYVFRLRLETLEEILQDKFRRQKLDREGIDYYYAAGFSNTRTLDRRLLQEKGLTYHQLIKRKDNS